MDRDFGVSAAAQLAEQPDARQVSAVYAIGLIFGIVFLRSGNVWIPAVMHGIRPQNMTQGRRHGRAISGGVRAW